MKTIIERLLRSAGMAALAAGLVATSPAWAQQPAEGDAAAATGDAADDGDAAGQGIFAYESKEEPPLFDTAEAAIDAFKAALADNSFDGLARLLGLDAARLRQEEGIEATFAQIREGTAKRLTIRDIEDGKILEIGDKLWPFPFPLLKGEDDGKWAFDTEAGLEEIVNRRVGENELEAVATMRAYVEAQKDYAALDRDADGVEEFAQKLISTEGQADGLYWRSDAEHGESPAGEFIDQAELGDAGQGEGYFGYRYKILTGQGDRIAGGAYDYVINGNMIGGFGLLAWPVRYAETGVRTFVVNQHGIVYEADLGPATSAIVKYIDRFNPDADWSVVGD